MPSRPSPPRRTSSLKRFLTYSLEAISPRSRKASSRSSSDDSTTKNKKIRMNSISYPTALVHCSSGICEGTWSDWEMCEGVIMEGGVARGRSGNGVTVSGVARLSNDTVRRFSRGGGGAKDTTKQMIEDREGARDSSFDWIDIPQPTPPRRNHSSIDSRISSSTHRTRKCSTASSVRAITSLPFHLEGFDYSFDEFGREWDALGGGDDEREVDMLVQDEGAEDDGEEDLESQCYPSFLFTNADESDETSTMPHESPPHSQPADDTASSFLDLDDLTAISLLPTLPFPPPPGRGVTPG